MWAIVRYSKGAGSVSYAQAIEKATAEYRKWQTNTLSSVEQEYMRTIKAIATDTKVKQ